MTIDDVRRCWKVPVAWRGRDGRMHEDWVCRDGTREEALASVAHTMDIDPGVTWWNFNFKRKEAWMADNEKDAGRWKNVPAQAVRPGDRVTIDGGYPEKVDRVVMRPGSVELSLSGGFASPRRMRFGKADMVRVAVGGPGPMTKGVRREG